MPTTKKRRSQVQNPNPADGWERVSAWQIVEWTRLLPRAERWRWLRRKKGEPLRIEDRAHGRIYEFKLQKGAWIRLQTSQEFPPASEC
jgi:hypothetical protein